MRRHLQLNSGHNVLRHLRTIRTTATEQPRALAMQERARQKIANIDRNVETPTFVDTFNRKHDYLRISLTERCNLRCFYCMPPDGVELSPKASILTDEEILRLAMLFVKNGVEKIRLTGGEPTIRKNIVQLVGSLNTLRQHGLQAIAMTSNGLTLHRKLPQLIDNGLTHLNLSLDTLDPFKFELMTRRLGHDAVMRTLSVASDSSKLRSVKLNVVVIRGLNDMEIPQFVELTKHQKLSVRFIEFMPFSGNSWDKRKMISSAELLALISAVHPGVCKVTDEPNDTARSYRIPGYQGTFGFISSMSNHFCSTCNRLRLTADGQIKVCLFDDKEVSLRDLIRSGASDSDLVEVIRGALKLKKEKHAEMEDIDVVKNRPMILIGVTPRRMSRTPITTHVAMATRLPASAILPERVVGRQLRYFSSPLVTNKPSLTHIDDSGNPNMVDVSSKEDTNRSATATGRIYIPKVAYDIVTESASDDHDHERSMDENLGQLKQKARRKGDVLLTARLAGIMAAKRTSDIIPLCHQIPLSHIYVSLTAQVTSASETNARSARSMATREELSVSAAGAVTDPATCSSPQQTFFIEARAIIRCQGKTGVEMEAMTAVSASLLTVWDMLKAVGGKEMVITDVYVSHKSGGRSGDFIRNTK